MFSFLTTNAKSQADPLVGAKVTTAWLRELPALDVIGRQQQVMRAFEGMRMSGKAPDLARVQAILYLDAALGADRRQLIKQYVENVDSNPKLSARLWQAIFDLTQGFLYAYQASLEHALGESGSGRMKPAVPMLFTRLLHYYGTDAKLRVFRFERWIPAKWIEVHRTYMRAIELGVEREACTLSAAGPSALPWTAELEYINVLLAHQLNTGNLTPAGLDWGTMQMRAWGRTLTLDAMPRNPEGFCVDVAGKQGLVRRTGNDAGSMLRYLDTTPLVNELDVALAALRQAEGIEQGPTSIISQQRLNVLEKVRPAVASVLDNDLRKGARTACAVAAKVRVGLGRICREIGAKDLEGSSSEPQSAEQIEVFAVSGPTRSKPRAADDHDSLVASLSAFSDPMWRVKDRSVAGLRISAGGGIGEALALGALVAVRQSDVTDWLLGVVRRLSKVSNDEVEAGVSIIAEHIVPVPLHSRRDPKDDAGFLVNGIDVSTIGPRFDGLYLPPPSRPDKPLSVKTLIVPTAEYSEGRQIMLVTGRSIYTVALRQLVEQRADWSWCAIQIVEKKARE